ncbi:MAG TPA: DMT family transporter [Vicinamibacterales bacterium]
MWVLPCICAWSLVPRLASSPGNLDPMGFLFWSSVISAACLFLCTCLTGHWTTLRAYSMTDLRRIAALATLGAFAYYALLYTAYEPGPSDHTAVVVIAQHTWPALTVLWSAALLRERLNGRMVVSLILGVAAVAIGASATPNAEDGLSKLPPAVLAAIIFGLYSTLLKRVAYEPVSSMTVGFSFAAFLSFVAASQLSTRSLMPDRAALTAAFVNGVFVNGLSYVCWHKALKAAPVKFVAPWVALTPLLAAAFAGRSIVFRPEHWIGIALVLVSTLLATTARGVAVREPLTPAPPPRGHGFNLAEESR